MSTTPSAAGQPSGGGVQEKAQELAGQAQDQAQQAAAKARSGLREQVERRSTQAGERVHGTAQDVRSVAEQLRQQGKDQPAKLASQAADRVERVGSYLRESDADRILGDVEAFARRQPWAIAVGGLLVGLAASRVLKASSTERYQRRGSELTPYGGWSRHSGRSPALTPPVAEPVSAGAPQEQLAPAAPLPDTAGMPSTTTPPV
jgi:hypothetical protein